MAKVYWMSLYKSVSDPAALAAYAELATPAMLLHGGKILARGTPVGIFEAGIEQRAVLIEFESLEAAKKAYSSPEYQNALKTLGNGAIRDIRLIESI